LLKIKINRMLLKGTVACDFVTDFFIPIDRPDLGDGPLKGLKFVRCACAEQQAFFALSSIIKRGKNAQFRVQNLHPPGKHEKSAKVSFHYSDLCDLNFYTHGDGCSKRGYCHGKSKLSPWV